MSEDLSWTQRPPSLDDPEEAVAARKILEREPGVARGHAGLGMLRQVDKEEYAADPNRLDSDKAWFVPCLAYCMVGLDRSLFELYSWAVDTTFSVITYKTGSPLFTFDGVDVRENPWFHTIQGIDRELRAPFVDYVESYEFRRKEIGLSWNLKAFTTRIADPFVRSDVREGASVTFLLPECSDGRFVDLTPGGLNLLTPSARLFKKAGSV